MSEVLSSISAITPQTLVLGPFVIALLVVASRRDIAIIEHHA